MNEPEAILKHAIEPYLHWLAENGYAQKTRQGYKYSLNHFIAFIKARRYTWEEIFTRRTLGQFKKNRGNSRSCGCAVSGLSRYLYGQGIIAEPIQVRKTLVCLPDIYEDYLLYKKKYHQASGNHATRTRRVLCAFHRYCQQNSIQLESLKIEHVDAYRDEFFKGFAGNTRHVYRNYLRQFLSYLYRERGILATDLAPLVVGRREYAQAKPPKFLRPVEIRQLFAGLNTSSASGIRTYAMVHLAYSMGLRPKEISQLRLNDISFGQQLLRVTVRKGDNPLELPIPEHTVKAVAAYIIGARPSTNIRRLFLTMHPPHRPMSPNTVGYHISKAMRQAGLNASAYWLRHTYAQNLLEAGASVFEIKEMLGHDKIESTKKYLHVHTKLMRQVLFDESL
jgi:site-specific recombinase XerD